MDSTAPFPFSAFSPHGEVSTALQAFRWLLVLGFPVAVAAAMVWPDFCIAPDEDDAPQGAGDDAQLYPPIL